MKGVTGDGYVWAFADPQTAVYVYSPTRDGDTPRQTLDGFKGVLVSDFYAAYDSLDCPQQKCLIHLIRDFNDDLLKSPFDAELKGQAARFTALLQHVSVDRLRTAYGAISPQAAPGVDGVTWATYGQALEENLQDLHRRVHSGAYRARPSRRAYIPKADGRQRPPGIDADGAVSQATLPPLSWPAQAGHPRLSYGG